MAEVGREWFGLAPGGSDARSGRRSAASAGCARVRALPFQVRL